MTEATFKLEKRRLGKSDLHVTSIGLGAWSWGATRFWGYGKRYGRKEVEEAWWKSIEMGVNFVDTASVYGNGESERIIGDLLKRTEQDIVIATKYFPLHLMTTSIRGAAERSLRRLGLKEVDLYQVHFPPRLMSLRGTMREMERLVKEGKVRYIGVSNFSVKQLEAARSYLSREEVVSNQIQYSLVHRRPEQTGMVEHARKEGVTIIAYSPIAMGLLTGKYNVGNRPGGVRKFNRKFSKKGMRQVAPFLAELREMAKPECGSMAQASLAWLLKDPNVVVIPGAKNPRQAEENVGAATCHITDAEVSIMDEAYSRHVPGW
jgi:aryl-alcohol dehydrogenase-like predicted oxidoreductase